MSYLPERIEATGRKLCYELKIFEAMGRIKSYMLVDIQTITRKQSYRLNDVEAIGWMSIPHRMDPTWCPPAGWAQGGRLLRPGNPPPPLPPQWGLQFAGRGLAPIARVNSEAGGVRIGAPC